MSSFLFLVLFDHRQFSCLKDPTLKIGAPLCHMYVCTTVSSRAGTNVGFNIQSLVREASLCMET